MRKPATITQEEYVRLGKSVENKLGIPVPMQCKSCGSVWKRVRVERKGKKITRRRVTCFMCGKRQYGKRAQVSRE